MLFFFFFAPLSLGRIRRRCGAMASATAARSGKLEGLVFLAHRSHRKFAATEQTQLQCCVSPWLCGCESYFKSEKRRKETRERGEEIQFTATPLSTGKNKLYSIDAVFPTEANSGKLSAKSQSTKSSHFNSAEYVAYCMQLEPHTKQRE